MARPKGSKNIKKEENMHHVEPTDEDLLGTDETEKIPVEDKKETKSKGRLLGYHVITGEEVWLE